MDIIIPVERSSIIRLPFNCVQHADRNNTHSIIIDIKHISPVFGITGRIQPHPQNEHLCIIILIDIVFAKF